MIGSRQVALAPACEQRIRTTTGSARNTNGGNSIMSKSEHVDGGQELLKPHEAAKLLGVHRATLGRLRVRVPDFPQPQNLGFGMSRVYRKSELVE